MPLVYPRCPTGAYLYAKLLGFHQQVGDSWLSISPRRFHPSLFSFLTPIPRVLYLLLLLKKTTALLINTAIDIASLPLHLRQKLNSLAQSSASARKSS